MSQGSHQQSFPSAGIALPYQYKPNDVTVLDDNDSGGYMAYQSQSYGSMPVQTAVPLQSPPPVYYGSWRDEQVEVIHRGDDLDLWCSLFIVFFFFFLFLVLIIVVSIEYGDDNYYRR